MSPMSFVRSIAMTLCVAASQSAAAAPQIIIRTVPAVQMSVPSPVLMGASQPPSVQWTGFPDQRVLRNVQGPLLYPVLPAAARANGKAVLVVPGGGYKFVAIENEGLPVAQRLADAGYAAFVLVYRVKPTLPEDAAFAQALTEEIAELFSKPVVDLEAYGPALEDTLRALRWIKGHAAQWGVDPKSVGYLGFSAGARTGRAIAEQASPEEMPATMALIYGGFTATKPRSPVPPLFLAQAADDPLFSLEGAAIVQNWQSAGQRAELHLYERGGHGFGLRQQGTTSDAWMTAYLGWLLRQ